MVIGALAWPLKAIENPLKFKGEFWARGTVDLKNERPYEDLTSDHETLLLQVEGSLTSLFFLKAVYALTD